MREVGIQGNPISNVPDTSERHLFPQRPQLVLADILPLARLTHSHAVRGL
jgi:hypothetical protein